MSLDARLERLIDWVRETAGAAPALLVPVSGGSDSALCLWLCARALPGRTVGVFIGDQLRESAWHANVAPLEMMDHPETRHDPEVGRWALLLSRAIAGPAWLVGTRNRTEEELGTFSMASRVASFLPIAGVWKTEVLALGALAGVPQAILASSRRADPGCGRPRELAEIPIEQVDRFLQARARDDAEVEGFGAGERGYLEGLMVRNAFKRWLPVRGPGLVESRFGAS